jgi:hypothetical protein
MVVTKGYLEDLLLSVWVSINKAGDLRVSLFKYLIGGPREPEATLSGAANQIPASRTFFIYKR